MNLNINELILTYEEMERIDRRPIGSYPGSMEEIAQAAVAKALWGLVDWIRSPHEPLQNTIGPLWDVGYWAAFYGTADMLEKNMNQAGIQRPGGRDADD